MDVQTFPNASSWIGLLSASRFTRTATTLVNGGPRRGLRLPYLDREETLVPVYDFRCAQCGHDFELIQPIASTTRTTQCPTCQGVATKVLTFPAIRQSLPEHFNTALGEYVTNDRDFRDGLKQKSDDDSKRHNRTVNYSPVDLRDKTALGVTEEGMDATRRHEVATGQREAKKFV